MKAFPDTIQVDEPGTLWNPTQGEIAAARKSELPSPSEIAKGGQSVSGKEAATLSPASQAKAAEGSIYGSNRPMPTPGEIARDEADVFFAEKSWVKAEEERRAKANEGNAEDQNERAKGRSLPEEQKQQEQERSRGR